MTVTPHPAGMASSGPSTATDPADASVFTASAKRVTAVVAFSPRATT